MNARAAAEEIFRAGVARVRPERLMGPALGGLDLSRVDRIFVIGAGKATGAMAAETEKILGDKITAGHIVVKYGHGCHLQRIRLTEAGHPTPDANGLAGADAVLRLARRAGEHDLTLCLLSGGGSALLSDGPLEEIIPLNLALVQSGAAITEINTVRKHLSRLKGGQLARAAQPSRVVSLILSDVIGDPLDVIASGPTAPDPSTRQDALDVLRKYGLQTNLPFAETPKPGDPIFQRVENRVIGNNQMALEACRFKAAELGWNPRIVTASLEGDVANAAQEILDAALGAPKRSCLLFGGEPTVKVTGPGRGGRSQRLALLAADRLRNHPGITLLAAGTDGTDGPTDAAGAVVDSNTRPTARDLRGFDSYDFFQRAGGHIITGPTLTNVMDLIVVLT
ncbi:MAG TPA: DUF4147 domain-containing protein [Verrucomicrobiae bacterium]|jgi:glycerate-2-kinase|nr:DUF4147 domain-containing protein [Verrucomicrobiae bacterium]